jgi:hypothetical protein
MNIQIQKYTIGLNEGTFLPLTHADKILHVGVQGSKDEVRMWVEKRDSFLEGPGRLFKVVLTGGYVSDRDHFIGTVLTPGGLYVGHVYEILD